MFRVIKLWFTDRNYYYQRKRYMKLQKEFRNKLKKQAKEFCPWSGYYMHKMITTMIKFYHETYLAGDCCWSEETRRLNIANTIAKATHYFELLDKLDEWNYPELIAEAQKYSTFNDRVVAFEKEIGKTITNCDHSEALLAGVAYDFLEENYTRTLYNILGEHIWEWCD
jgi:hypothetical protein